MTPNRRLDQLEPLMADALQKIDRLIEGQGQLAESNANMRVELYEVKEIVTKVDATAQITAKGLANLTISSQKQFEELKAGQEELRANQDLLQTGMGELRTNQESLQTGIGELRANQESLQTGLEDLTANQESLKAGQDAIMQFLREKFS